MRRNNFKLKEGKFVAVRKIFFTHRVMRQWNRLPREIMAAPFLKVFKSRLDGALNSLSWWVEGGLELDGL